MENNNSVFSIPATSNPTEQTFDVGSSWGDAPVFVQFLNFLFPVYHTHVDLCEILLVISGSAVHVINGKEHLMNPGDCCFIRKTDYHKFSPIDPSHPSDFIALNFSMRQSFCDEFLKVFGEDAIRKFEAECNHMTYTFDAMQRKEIYSKALLARKGVIPTEEQITQCKILTADILLKLVNHVFSPKTEFPEWFENFLLRLQAPANFQASLKDLLKGTPYSYSYVAQNFKKLMGCSIVSYINTVKVKHAKELLAHTDMTTLSVASRLGFDSLSHFNHIFKDHLGITPSQYRKQLSSITG